MSDDFQPPPGNYVFPAPPDPDLWERFWRLVTSASGVVRTAEFGLVFAAVLGVWLANGDITLTVVVLVVAAFFLFLGLFSTIPRKWIASAWFAVGLLALTAEGIFVVEHARPPVIAAGGRSESVQSPEPQSVLPPPAKAVPAQIPYEPPPIPTKGATSPEDAATQLGVWESIASDKDTIAGAYNSLDLALVRWESKVETLAGRADLARSVRDAAANLVSACLPLEAVRTEYPQLQSVVAALSNSPAEGVMKAASAFADAVTRQNGSEFDKTRVVTLRPLEGALRLQMGAMDNWMSDLGRTASLRVHDLSGVK